MSTLFTIINWIDIYPIKKPIKILPASPMNKLAGGLLKIRYPIIIGTQIRHIR
jgi:hypothetical protein